MFDIHCPSDGTVYHADESHLGKSIRCQKCGAILKVEKVLHTPLVQPGRQSVRPVYDPERVKHSASSESTNKSRLLSVAWDRLKLYMLGVTIAVVVVAVAWLLIFMLPQFHLLKSSPLPVKTAPVVTDFKPIPLMKAPEFKPLSIPKPLRPLPKLMQLAPIELRPTCAIGQEPERLPTGEDVEPEQEAIGECRLIVKNGSGHDAAVRLMDFDSGQTIRFVYVRSGDSYPILGIGDVTASVRFETGADWIPACKGFIKGQDIEEFDDLIRFRVRTDEDEDSITTYSTHASLTLNPVIGGNAKTHRIDRNRFFQGDQYVRLAP